MEHFRQALHVPSLSNSPVPVAIEDQLAGAMVVAMRHDELPGMLVVVDVQAVDRAVHGHPATIAMPLILNWAFEVFPASVMDSDITLVHINFEGAVKLMAAGALYRVSWTPVKWPGCKVGSIAALSGAFPGYSAALMSDMEDLVSCVH